VKDVDFGYAQLIVRDHNQAMLSKKSLMNVAEQLKE